MMLLVSVRSVEEAEAALEGGADWIDVKDPARGSLGRADEAILAAVVQQIAARRPVSAALGELSQSAEGPAVTVPLVKWGLSGLLDDWQTCLLRASASLLPGCRAVAVAYADAVAARAPAPEQVCAFACKHQWAAFLLDTWAKDGRTLLEHLTLPQLTELRKRCRDSGVNMALAGSLSRQDLVSLRHLEPTWFAVRSAACVGGRQGHVQAEQVRLLRTALYDL